MTSTGEPPKDYLPSLARPSREQALDFAKRMFVHGDRVDMRTLAGALGVGRTTLYRWVGDREQLIGHVLAELTRQTWLAVADHAEGEGLERALDTLRRFMVATADFPPLRQFAQNEPAVALRVLMAENGAVSAALREGIARAMAENLTAEVDPERIDILVQLGTAMEWAPVVIGEAPAIDRAIALMRSLLRGAG
ncbi:QsdR family transcriptional regulator [Streptomyces sp. NRRL B-24572]|uniref:QsdR family transcriptional regulator n=1 Tax=Streptomyces sp. NRRL B-24572 TaxID=1962156 RepID=UPI0011801C2E|nr:QsdR family transcriptional regulator [Streptomyces sp. NRRL B-24572]